jgi:hypothetical protein
MKILTYDEIGQMAESNVFTRAREMIKEIEPVLAKKYRERKERLFPGSIALASQLIYLIYATSGEMKGKAILDLGCGSKSPLLECPSGILKDKAFEPWLCRALVELGSKPIGIDIGNLEGETFRHYELNLYARGSLDYLKSHSVDVANAHLLFDSPHFKRMAMNRIDFKKILIPQLERIVRAEGYFIYSS